MTRDRNMAALKEVLVIGGTGAQGVPIVEALSKSNRYIARVLTRDPSSSRSKSLASLPNVKLMQGSQTNQEDLHAAFRGVYAAFVNLDGFTIGEKDELFYGIRSYEIARSENVEHFIWGNLTYTLKELNWDEKYYGGHFTGKGRVGDFILAQGQNGMKSSLFTTVPYMEMLFEGMFVPHEQKDGSMLWVNPAGDARVPMISLEDVGHYFMWIIDNPSESAGVDLEMTTDAVTFAEVAKTFTKVTGKDAAYRYLPFDEYAPYAEPYPNAPVNWSTASRDKGDRSAMTWRENFSAWWRFYDERVLPRRNLDLLDRIHPNRIRNLEEWMNKVKYDGKTKSILKDVGDMRKTIEREGRLAELKKHYQG